MEKLSTEQFAELEGLLKSSEEADPVISKAREISKVSVREEKLSEELLVKISKVVVLELLGTMQDEGYSVTPNMLRESQASYLESLLTTNRFNETVANFDMLAKF